MGDSSALCSVPPRNTDGGHGAVQPRPDEPTAGEKPPVLQRPLPRAALQGYPVHGDFRNNPASFPLRGLHFKTAFIHSCRGHSGRETTTRSHFLKQGASPSRR